jgi:hypothetical protein
VYRTSSQIGRRSAALSEELRTIVDKDAGEREFKWLELPSWLWTRKMQCGASDRNVKQLMGNQLQKNAARSTAIRTRRLCHIYKCSYAVALLLVLSQAPLVD